MDTKRIVVISGERGCGKTTLCRRVVELARARGLTVGGVLTHPRFVGGRKVGLVVEDLQSGSRCPLAEREDSTDGPSTGRWHFHAAGLDLGAQALAWAAPCELLIVDELGPLELERGEGWAVAMGTLAAGCYRLALVVVRPRLLPEFRRQLGLEPAILLARAEECEALAARILSELGVRV
jgi:nucleoside-triphosphatase THEP1